MSNPNSFAPNVIDLPDFIDSATTSRTSDSLVRDFWMSGHGAFHIPNYSPAKIGDNPWYLQGWLDAWAEATAT